jgi:Holliday junction resolvasome RuvABC endonuclease subunit
MAGLSDFRPKDDPDLVPALAHILGVQTDFEGKVLAFDQTLANTGWAEIVIGHGAHFVGTGCIHTPEFINERTKTHGYFARADMVLDAVERLLKSAAPDLVVLELPPTSARQMKQVVSPTLAGYSVWRPAAYQDTPIEIVQAQKAKKRWTGQAGSDKKAVREAVLYHFPEVARHRVLNEHVYDAIILGLTGVEQYAPAKSS